MPTPEGLNTTTLHGLYVEPNATGTPLQGTLSFSPTPSFILFPTEDCIIAGTETATLDVNGEFTIELVSTDNAGSNPTGWLYTVTEKIIGQRQRTYNISLNYTSGVTVELADIQPSDDAPTYIPVIGPQGSPGIVTTVNGHSASSITLTAADVSAIATSARGAANGVASLDGTTKVPTAQLPDLTATYVPWANVEVANGVASLDGSAKIKATELNLASSAPAAIGTGAVGTSTNLARQDHTHDGVSLASSQVVTGFKTFEGATSTTGGIQFRVTSDANSRWFVRVDGRLSWGDGTATQDTVLYRNAAAGTLKTDGIFQVGGALQALAGIAITGVGTSDTAPTLVNHLTRKDYVDTNFTTLTTAQTVSGVKTFSAAPIFTAAAAATIVTNYRVTGDTVSRQTVAADGKMSWGLGGSTATDVTLFRSAAGILAVGGELQAQNATAGLVALASVIGANTFDSWRAYADGKQEWGTGAVTRDTNLYRTGVGILTTDGDLNVGGALQFAAGPRKKTIISTATTLGTSATETVIATMSIPAGDLAVGSAFRFKIHGNISFLASATITYKVRWGGVAGTNMGTIGPITLSATAQTNKEMVLEAYWQVRTISATGTVFGNLIHTGSGDVTTAVGDTLIGSSDGAVTIDTTAATTIVVTAQWGASSASNTLTAYATMERLS